MLGNTFGSKITDAVRSRSLMQELLQLLQLGVDGIAVGSILALAAVGLTMTYGILKLSNFAHGDLLTLGAYVALFANGWLESLPESLGLREPLNWLAGFPLSIVLSLPLGCLATVLVVLLLDKAIWSSLRQRRATPTTMMIVSIGVALVMRNLIILIWGASPQKYSLPTFEAVKIFGLLITRNRMVAIALAVAVISAIYFLLQNTKIGRAMRAVADSPELARISGINVDRIVIWTWAIAGASAALSGCMYGLFTNLRPNMGWSLILPIFASVILGGIGNPYGAIAGAMIIGMAQEVSTFCPASLGGLAKYCIGTEYKLGVGLAIMILVLLFRPQGLFKGTV
jgi:neutral amino acid transport system permease protein